MTSNTKSTRDRAPKCSIVLSNVLAVVFRPTSTAVQIKNIHHDDNCENKDSKPSYQVNGLELFDAFKEANRSTMLTRLTESLDEIRLKGWVFPFTLLIKGPHEDVEVIKEAWRRHFLRSPDNFVIKDIGAVSSVGMEVIQQAPFLPLTKSLMETIYSLNNSQLVATQQSIAECLAKTYQYVHVPKLNVIHDCLGILIKERKIYHTGNGYFVLAHNPFDKPVHAPKQNSDVPGSKDSKCVACEVISKGKAAKAEKTKKKVKGKEIENGKVKTAEKEMENNERKKTADGKGSESKRVVDVNEGKSLAQEKEEEINRTVSETTSESGASEEATKKSKKQKKGVLNRISSFVKGKTIPSSDIEETKQEEIVKAPSPPLQHITLPEAVPLATQEEVSQSNLRRAQFRALRTLSAPAGRPSCMGANVYNKDLEELKQSEIKSEGPKTRQFGRSKSFVAMERRSCPPVPVMRSNSFTASSTKVARQITTESAPGTWDRRMRMSYGTIIRNSPVRQTIHVSRPSSCNIGIIRPLSATPQKTLSRSNSVKKEMPGKKRGSLSPPSSSRNLPVPSSIPQLKERSQGREKVSVVRNRSFTEPGLLRMTNRQVAHRATIAGPFFESPLQQLLARNPNGHISPPSPGVRVTVPPKGRHYVQGKHPITSTKRTPPSSPQRKKHPVSPRLPLQKQNPDTPRNKSDCTSPVCYDTSFINNTTESSKCNGIGNANGTPFTPSFLPSDNYNDVSMFSDDVSSEHICIEEMTPTVSEDTLIEDRYTENGPDDNKPLGVYKTTTEQNVNDSLTFIGII